MEDKDPKGVSNVGSQSSLPQNEVHEGISLVPIGLTSLYRKEEDVESWDDLIKNGFSRRVGTQEVE